MRPMREDIWYLNGKSTEQVVAESAALGLSYGEYSTAIKTGIIEAVLLERRIYDGPARIRRAAGRIKRRVYRCE